MPVVKETAKKNDDTPKWVKRLNILFTILLIIALIIGKPDL